MILKNNKNPLVSIIIPTYNRANLISETLDSILAQKYNNWECIIVDDGSTDNTDEIVKKYTKSNPRFKFYKRPEQYKQGANGARNFGFDVSNGDFIQWFDSDDLMHEELLLQKINVFNSNPDVQSIISRLYFFENKGGENIVIGENKFRQPSDLIYENILTWSIPVWTQSIMFKKQFLINVNERLDESLKRVTDYDFHSRIFIKHPNKVYLLDKPLCYIRRNNNSITVSYFSKERVTDLEKSEYIVANKIIRLLINENKFTENLEKFFYRDHKKRISNLIKASDTQINELFGSLVELYLKYKNKRFKLVKFRLGFSLLKKMPIDNFFLIYRPPVYILFFTRNLKSINKIIFTQGYLKQKFQEKRFIQNKKIIVDNIERRG